MVPDGWSAVYPKAICLQHRTGHHDINFDWVTLTKHDPSFKVTLKANEYTEAYNRIYIALEAMGYPEPLVIPVTVLG